MPDKWELEKVLDPDDAMDSTLVPDGYTNLKDYFTWLASGNKPS